MKLLQGRRSVVCSLISGRNTATNDLPVQPNPVHLTEQLDGFVVIGYCSSPILAHCQVTKGNQKLLLRPIQQH
ncbi:MAG: hypothetical protein WB988_19330, partial [Candidatus Nitrosopolaris sp.]